MAEITLFTKKDIPGFVEFRHKCKKESPFLNDSNITLATEQQEEYTAENKKAYLLKDRDKVIGQLFIKYHPKTNIIGLGLISVLQEYQGKGYAKKLLAMVDQYAKEKNAEGIELYVDKANTVAIKVYEKMGYRKIKDHGKNRLLYVKNIKIKESKLTKSTSPKGLLKWMNQNLTYEGKNKGYLRTPEQVVKDKLGHCWETAELANKELTDLGYICQTLFMVNDTLYNKNTVTHSTIIFKNKENEYYWFEWAWGKHEGVHGPYKNLNEIKDYIINCFKQQYKKIAIVKISRPGKLYLINETKYIDNTDSWINLSLESYRNTISIFLNW